MHAQQEGAVRTGALPWFEVPVLGFAGAHATITVMLASAQSRRHVAWLSWMAWEPDIEIVGGPVTDAVRLAAALTRQCPQVLLLDSAMLEHLDRPALRRIARCRGMRVLLMAEEAGMAEVTAVLRHRFHGLLPAAGPTPLCMKAIRAVSAGELWLSRKLMAECISDVAWPMVPVPEPASEEAACGCPPKALTRRERQVVAGLNQGRSNKEIARELGIVEDTVKKHLKSVYAKLGVRRRAMVILQAAASA